MRKPANNLSIDTAAFIAFIFLMSTGSLIYWVLPAGSGGKAICGLTRHDWGEIHFWIAAGFVALISTHFILHWSWIKHMVMRKVIDQKKSKFRITAAVLSILTDRLKSQTCQHYGAFPSSDSVGFRISEKT